MTIPLLTYRRQIQPSDVAAITRIVKSSGFFSQAEIDLAEELAEEKLADENSSYQFLFGEKDGQVCGYTCFGLIPATAGSYDIYWIAVDEQFRGKGIGKVLLTKTENIIRNSGGNNMYIETSSREQYSPTQGFYVGCGYHREACLKDFYAPNDSMLIYSKAIK
jgi:ribosomal protein S18 acetylase RimI-like enzyme